MARQRGDQEQPDAGSDRGGPARDPHLDPEPLDVDVEDVVDAFPHDENPHPPSEAQVPAP